MKLAAVLALVAVAFASTQWDMRPEMIRETYFRSGDHYTFRFDGQIATGLPLPSSQHAATRIQSIVSLYFENDRTAILKMQKIRVGSAHRDLVEPRDLHPFGLFEEMELSEEYKEMLTLPVRFRYERGLISEVEMDREDQPWSENIKRAVLNMLQINLSKKARTDQAEMSRMMRDTDLNEFPDKDYFTTNELTLEGDCETAYTVVPLAEEKLRVSKSINFEKCNKRIDIRYNFRFGEECPSCEKKLTGEERNTESSTVITFELNGNTDKFLIRDVELRSQYLFSPVAKEQGMMVTFVNNKLTLLKVDTSSKLEVPRTKKISTIVYSTEWEEKLERFRMTGEEEILREVSFPWMHKKMEVVKMIVKDLLREMSVKDFEDKDSFRPELNHYIARLVEVLRVCTKEELKKIGDEMEKKEVRAIFYDALSIAATKTTIEYLTEKMITREMSVMRASRVLKELINVRNPSEKIIDHIIRVCKEDISERNPILKQSCWLTVGTLLNGLCGEKRESFALEVSFDKESKKNICPAVLKEKYVEVLKRFFEKADGRYEKVLALKTMANTGMDLIVFPLEKMIKDEREDKIVRMQAIDALRKLRSVMPRKVHSILMPIFKNIREYPEIRVAAFHQIMHTIPERAVIDQITVQLEREPSRQVYTYVYTTLKSLAKSDIPCEKDMARDIEQSLRLVRVQPRRLLDSHLMRATFYDNEYYTGASVNWAVFFSNDSVLPKEVMASLDTVFAGEWNKYLAQIGFSQHNFDHVLYKLLEKFEDREDLIVRGKRATVMKPVEALRKLMEKMGIERRRVSSEPASAMVYLRYKDMDYAVLPIEEKIISSLLKESLRDGKIHLGELERVLSKGYRFSTELTSFIFETTRVIPTTLGMPLEITGKMPTVFVVEGEVKADFAPETSRRFSGVRFMVRAEPKVSATHISHMEIRSPIVSTGTKILHNVLIRLPIDMDLELNWDKTFESKLIIRAPETRDEKRIFSLTSRPVTYIRHEKKHGKVETAMEKTIFLSDLPTTDIDKVLGEKALGLHFNLRGNVHRHLLEKMQEGKTLPIFICENWMELTMKKAQDTPREYVISMKVDAFDETTTSSEMGEFERFYEKDVEEHFQVEDSDYLREDEMERRTSFDKYIKNYKTSPRKNVYSHRVYLKANTVGSSMERRGEMDVKVECDHDMTYCHWKLDASRTPLFEKERRDWTLSAIAKTLFPEPIHTLKQLHEQKHREMVAVVEAKWGSEEKNVLKVRLQGEQSKEQQKWQKLTIRKERRFDNLQRLELAARLNQIKVVADYNIVPETLVYLDRFYSLLKAYTPFTSTVEPRRLEKVYSKEGRLLAKLTVEPQTWRYVNLSMEIPSERLILENIRLPFRPTWLSIEKVESVRNLRDVTRRLTSDAKCEVSSSRINTFDDVVYRAPLTTCYSVLAKDCSEEPKFAVLMKKVDKRSEEKKMKIVTEDRIITLEMKKNGDFVVEVDGKIVKEWRKLEELGLEKRGDVMVYTCDDFFVRFDGYKAELKLNELFKNKQCGMCGHYDGEYEGEFRRADNVITDDMEEFHRSFLARDDECEIEEEELSKKDNYKKYDKDYKKDYVEYYDEERFYDDLEHATFQKKDSVKERRFSSYEQDETIEPIEKTRVIETPSRVCFSVEPVPECPKKSHKDETLKLKVKFACLDRHSSEARRMLREVRREVISVHHLKHSFVEELVVPKTCLVY